MPQGERSALGRGLGVLGTAIREEKRMFLIALSGSAVFAATTVASAFVMGEVIERAVLPAFRAGRTTAGTLTLAALAIFGVTMLKVVGITARRLGAGTMTYRLQATYRRRVTRQYLRLPLSWHHRHPTGELLSNANSDVEATWHPVSPMPFACGTIIMLVITAVALVVADPVLALVGFVVFPALFGINAVYTNTMSPRMTLAQQLRADVSEVAHESFDGALVVKTLGREETETERFRARALELRDALVAVGRVRGTFDPMMEALPNLGTLAVLLVGGLRLSSGATDLSDLVSIAYLFTILAIPVRAIGWVLGDLPRAVVGWTRVQRVLTARGGQSYGTSDLPRSARPAELAVRGLSFAYRSHSELDPDGDPALEARQRQAVTVLHDVTLGAPPGRTLAVVGPTGSGKSTLVSLLIRLVDPDSGAVLLDGTDVRALRAGGLSTHAALVGQSTFLFDDSVRGNVTLGLDVDDAAVWQALGLAQADGFVRRLPDQLDTQIGERGTTLSGGQRQRLALARALVRRPRLLVLDDATSSVDPAVEQAILGGLRDADLASTVVVVAYRRATIALADEVVYVENGRVLARGEHRDLVRSTPGYARLVNAYADAEAERVRERLAARGADGELADEEGVA